MPGNYVLLETIQLTENAASVTFDNIPQTGYTDLKIVASGRSNRGAHEDSINVRFGTGGTLDTGSNYSYSLLYEYAGGNLTASWASSQTYILWQSPVTATNATANTFGNSYFEIPNYTSSSSKSLSGDSVTEHNGTEQLCGITAGRWSGTGAINMIALSPTAGTQFTTGSTFGLYGIAATDATPAIAPKATGGNMVSTDGTYWYHTFLSSGYFVPQVNLTCHYLVIAGGGPGGGGNGGGGGGAGGLRSTVTATGGGGSLESPLSLTPQNYPILVGAGGAGAQDEQGGNGSNSVFSTITSIGGGAGGTYGAARSGGSGGGSTRGAAISVGTANQGYAGGSSVNGPNYGTGGGGGAGAVGGNGTTSVNGNGGNGVAVAITGTSVTYAGGGGGGLTDNNAAGTTSGGTGGGGAGNNGSSRFGSDGVASTGSGGGGGGSLSGGGGIGYGGSGGSGIVIIRYPVAS